MSAGGEMTTTLSPDGSFRVETLSQPEERGPALETTRIVMLPGEQIPVYLPLYGTTGVVRFPGPGLVALTLRGRDYKNHELRVNVPAGTFMLDGDRAEQDLQTLQARLGLAGSPGDRGPVRSPLFSAIGNVVPMTAGCLILVVAGIWMSLAAEVCGPPHRPGGGGVLRPMRRGAAFRSAAAHPA